ncbi:MULTISPECIES: DUF2268 domain-containing putative Zn-dependent protease [unclassified Lysinibacillus]|uniref:DUF2268 domain-containing putative Zn-dependent protease n=1 Tax=unclassified Lysinibacillus TaxID=2636778 RepID=UPI0038068387
MMHEKKENLYHDIEHEVATYIKSASIKLMEVPTNVFLLPLITTDVFYLEKMNGILAHTDGTSNIFIYLNVDKRVDSKFIQSISFHEYQHVVRNTIVKKKDPKTLLDVMIDEGCSELFVEYALGKDFVGEWATSLSNNEINQYIERFKHKLSLTKAEEIQKFMYGNTLEYPLWLGYSMGYYIVNNFMKKEPQTQFEHLIRLNPYQIYYNSTSIDR